MNVQNQDYHVKSVFKYNRKNFQFAWGKKYQNIANMRLFSASCWVATKSNELRRSLIFTANNSTYSYNYHFHFVFLFLKLVLKAVIWVSDMSVWLQKAAESLRSLQSSRADSTSTNAHYLISISIPLTLGIYIYLLNGGQQERQ